MSNQAYPLSWPTAWPRVKWRNRSNFGERSIAVCVDEILRQLSLLGATSTTISSNLELRQDGLPKSNQRQPSDVGVAVYFKLKKADRVLACDKWARIEDNMWAIAKHVDALRGQQRWGVGSIDQAFAGYTALPAAGATTGESWWSVLEVNRTDSGDLIRAAYRAKAKVMHPDMGGTADAFQRIQTAWEQAEKERGL